MVRHKSSANGSHYEGGQECFPGFQKVHKEPYVRKARVKGTMSMRQIGVETIRDVGGFVSQQALTRQFNKAK